MSQVMAHPADMAAHELREMPTVSASADEAFRTTLHVHNAMISSAHSGVGTPIAAGVSLPRGACSGQSRARREYLDSKRARTGARHIQLDMGEQFERLLAHAVRRGGARDVEIAIIIRVACFCWSSARRCCVDIVGGTAAAPTAIRSPSTSCAAAPQLDEDPLRPPLRRTPISVSDGLRGVRSVGSTPTPALPVLCCLEPGALTGRLATGCDLRSVGADGVDRHRDRARRACGIRVIIFGILQHAQLVLSHLRGWKKAHSMNEVAPKNPRRAMLSALSSVGTARRLFHGGIDFTHRGGAKVLREYFKNAY